MVSGANAVMGPQAGAPRATAAMTLDAGRGKAPLLTIFGGDVTTSRLRAERAVSRPDPVLSDVAALDRQEAVAQAATSPGRSSRIRSIARASAGVF